MAMRADRIRVAGLVPEEVAAGEHVLKDCYDAAVNGLLAADMKKRGAKEKLGYIVARIEQEVYPDQSGHIGDMFEEDARRQA